MVIAAAGDIACDTFSSGSTACQQKETSDLLLDINPNAVLMLGDAQYPYATNGIGTYYDASWGRVLDKTYATNGGSHDFYGGGAWYDYFGPRAGPGPYQQNYSFNLGAWHIASANGYCSSASDTNGHACTTSDESYKWLQNDLANNSKPCTLVFWHQPRWSSGTVHGSDTAVKALFDLAYDYGVDVVLNGHEHVYERFAPLDKWGNVDRTRGVRQFTVGVGGRSFYDFGTPVNGSEVRINDAFGVIKMTLNDGSYDWQFLQTISGASRDSGSEACR